MADNDNKYGPSLASSGIQAASGIAGTLLQNRANRKLAEYGYSKDVEMWNRQNQYNAPTAQMKRLKDAGLNPNLIYGTGTKTGQASQMPKYNAPTMDYSGTKVEATQMLGQYQNLKLANAQIDNLKAQRDNTTARTINEGIRALGYKTGNRIQQQQLNRLKNSYGSYISKMSAEADSAQTRSMTSKLDFIYKGQQIKSLKAETGYKQFVNELAEQGMTTTDSWLMRTLFKQYKKYSGNIEKFRNTGKW